MKKRMMNALTGCLAVSAGLAGAQPLHVVIPEKASIVERYADGSQASLPTETVWRYMCGSDTTGLTEADLLEIAVNHADLVDQGVTTINNTSGRGGIDVIFNVSGSLPSGASGALAIAEAAIESNFSDPTTVIVSLSFANLGSGVLGATGSSYVTETYANTRAGLVNGMDGDDSIQSFLPTGTTIPVLYNESSTTITNENRVFVTRANYKAGIGSSGGTDASMQYNTNFNWDFDPTNGVSTSSYSFVDVIIHEVGHAMGFTSGSDFRTNDMEALDLYRFQRLDGSGDYNPDTTAEFQTTPRTVDLINTDNENSDIISAEYRMSDGSPYQTSHFREQGNCSPTTNIGIMDPAFSNGCTFFSRGYYSDGDIDMFDAIGYDVVNGNPPSIITQPSPDTVCQGQTAQLTVVATGDAPLSYQWYDLFLAPVSGATSATLSITNAQESDEGLYFCRVTNPLGSVDSSFAMITVDQGPSISDQPDSQTINEGDNVTFTVVANGTPTLTYQWRKNGSNIGGATGTSYTINNATPADDGNYSVVVSNGCGNTTSSNAALTVNPDMGVCLPDVNHDGIVSPADFSAWVAAFNTMAPECDQNADGSCTPADFSAWVANYNAGCP
ncbi:MAG: immunoglobulin domain-containing protein [Phycisphaerales bacterium]|nr:immunoglobulin domain-containing protein [Phycisphaerales bacterium]MCB9837613.1 immunoglobulin domain-containing protein [Phycisphaera sp.]